MSFPRENLGPKSLPTRNRKDTNIPVANQNPPKIPQTEVAVSIPKNDTAVPYFAIPVTGNDVSVHLQVLDSLTCSYSILKKKGFIVQQLEEREVHAKRHCIQCDKSFGNKIVRATTDGEETLTNEATEIELNEEALDNEIPNTDITENEKNIRMRCRCHPGRRMDGLWTCCKKKVNDRATKPCQQHAEHKSREYRPGELEASWKFWSTPNKISSDHRKAVAIDCEMGMNEDCQAELLRYSLVDYLTGEILIDRLVFPFAKMRDLLTRFSGVTWNQLYQAKNSGMCFRGRDAARGALWRYIGPETIVITHSGTNDFKALRWIHSRIVDTFLIEEKIFLAEKEQKQKEEEEKARIEREERIARGEQQEWEPDPKKPKEKLPKTPKGHGPLSLRTLTMRRVGRAIQVGKRGHSSAEDALATRDLARWHVVEAIENASAHQDGELQGQVGAGLGQNEDLEARVE